MVSKICVTLCILAVFGNAVLAQQRQQQQQPQTVREKNNNDGSGNYLFTYELDNEQIFSETGALKHLGNGKQAAIKSGSYSFIGPDGVTYWVNYYADETGFHPTIGSGIGGITRGGDSSINPNALKSLVG